MLSIYESYNNYFSSNRNVESANTITSWTPDAYKFASNRPKLQSVPTPVDFMSRLDSNVKSIDFNSCQPVKKEEDSYGLVSIHKRDRNTSPNSSSSSTNDMKKKRFKLAPLGNVSTASLPSSSTTMQEPTIPTDRGELLRMVRSYPIVNCFANSYFLLDKNYYRSGEVQTVLALPASI